MSIKKNKIIKMKTKNRDDKIFEDMKERKKKKKNIPFEGNQ